MQSIPVKSAKNQPIGIAHQIPQTPIEGCGASKYASKTLVPKEIIVKTKDISGFSMPR